MSGRIARAGFLCGILLFASTCDAWLTKPSLYNAVTVIVSRRNGEPVVSANVALYTGQRPMGYATTGSDGQYVFRDVPQGIYGVILTPPVGYEPFESVVQAPPSLFHDKLVVAEDTLSPVRFTLLKQGPGTVTVHVADPTLGDMKGVTVTLYNPQSIDAKSITDAAGRAAFANVPFGVHGVVVERPFLYRDFRTPNDSLYAYHDGLIVDDGSTESTTFQLKRCAGIVRASAIDAATNSPVPGVTALFYTPTQQLALSATGPDGRVTSGSAPCATQLGVFITPAPGYSVAEGRGSRFIDGLTVTDGATVDITFRLTRTR